MRLAVRALWSFLLAAGAAAEPVPQPGPIAGHSAGRQAARTALVREAERALTAGPFSVMDKLRVPPSGDKHDFFTLAP